MKKFDRAILIFIGLGIWALAMTQVLSLRVQSLLGDHVEQRTIHV